MKYLIDEEKEIITLEVGSMKTTDLISKLKKLEELFPGFTIEIDEIVTEKIVEKWNIPWTQPVNPYQPWEINPNPYNPIIYNNDNTGNPVDITFTNGTCTLTFDEGEHNTFSVSNDGVTTSNVYVSSVGEKVKDFLD